MQQVREHSLELQHLLHDEHYIIHFTITENYSLFSRYHQEDYFLQQHMDDLHPQVVDEQVLDIIVVDDIVVVVVDDLDETDEIF